MRVKTYAPLTRSDINGADAAPEWFGPILDAVLERFNETLKHYEQVLSKRISLAENIDCTLLTINVGDGAAVEVLTPGIERALGVSLIAWGTGSPTLSSWEQVENQRIRVTVTTNDDTVSSATVTLIVWGSE